MSFTLLAKRAVFAYESLTFSNPRMKLIFCAISIFSLTFSIVRSEVADGKEDVDAALTDAQKKSALGFLKSTDRNKRTGAINALHKAARSQKEECKTLLDEAREYHAKALDKESYELSFGENTLTEFEGLHRDWNRARDKALEMILTDWHKEQAKMTEMDSDFAKVGATWERMVRGMKKAGVTELVSLEAKAEAIMELDAELASYEDDDDFDFGGNLVSVLRSIDAGDGLIKILDMKKEVSGILADYAAVTEFNGASKWASPGQTDFAKILNGRRYLLGLSVLRLDENLSKGCGGHSQEMKTLGYFAHESPTPANQSFSMRAKNAKFEGFATGECIFMGGGGAPAAHQGWWYSDGHRLIMYARGPNTLGIGIAGNYWTLNTGQKTW